MKTTVRTSASTRPTLEKSQLKLMAFSRFSPPFAMHDSRFLEARSTRDGPRGKKPINSHHVRTYEEEEEDTGEVH